MEKQRVNLIVDGTKFVHHFLDYTIDAYEFKFELNQAIDWESSDKKDQRFNIGNWKRLATGIIKWDGCSHVNFGEGDDCLLYTSPSPRDKRQSRMPSSA